MKSCGVFCEIKDLEVILSEAKDLLVRAQQETADASLRSA